MPEQPNHRRFIRPHPCQSLEEVGWSFVDSLRSLGFRSPPTPLFVTASPLCYMSALRVALFIALVVTLACTSQAGALEDAKHVLASQSFKDLPCAGSAATCARLDGYQSLAEVAGNTGKTTIRDSSITEAGKRTYSPHAKVSSYVHYSAPSTASQWPSEHGFTTKSHISTTHLYFTTNSNLNFRF